MTLNFDYPDWDGAKHSLLERSGSSLGFAVADGGVEVGKAKTVRQGSRDSTIGPSIEGVIGNLAAAIEWCRWYGLSTSEVESKVRAAITKDRATERAKRLRDQNSAINMIADASNRERYIAKEKVVW